MIKLIVAMDDIDCIGKDGHLPWHIPEDLQFFKKITEGHSVLMGRITWESLPKKPLPKRFNTVVSRNQQFLSTLPPKVNRANNINMAILDHITYSIDGEDLFIIGGAQIYAHCLQHGFVDEMYITKVHTIVKDGDRFFPQLFEEAWNINILAKAKSNNLSYTISHWKKKILNLHLPLF